MAIKDYSTEPDMNTTISGINIAEGCAPSGINNAIRQLMADVKAEKDAQSTKDASQDADIANKLDKSGDDMTGNLYIAGGSFRGVWGKTADNDFYFGCAESRNSGDASQRGAFLLTRSRNASYLPGSFELVANDPTSGEISLRARPDVKALDWGGKNIVRRVNGQYANNDGEVNTPSMQIELTGGVVGFSSYFGSPISNGGTNSFSPKISTTVNTLSSNCVQYVYGSKKVTVPAGGTWLVFYIDNNGSNSTPHCVTVAGGSEVTTSYYCHALCLRIG